MLSDKLLKKILYITQYINNLFYIILEDKSFLSDGEIDDEELKVNSDVDDNSSF